MKFVEFNDEYAFQEFMSKEVCNAFEKRSGELYEALIDYISLRMQLQKMRSLNETFQTENNVFSHPTK